ncbi:hypothetical protein Hypma_002525 [Hypsizygus marmoreus]|uniref:Uncharacterized protein n=1 Tax=Hypsizygus marmoreus TaxID=39966 RepID=A0A369J4J1_HYPMA|nr:hypothetical protein Hypma_002525 [Hypsizygus marmoreus]
MEDFCLFPEDHKAIVSAATNNEFLPASLHSTVHRLITDTERSTELLDDEIVRAQAVIDRLHNQHSRLVSQLQDYRTVVAPHRKLPVEMLREIFITCSRDPLRIPVQLDRAPWTLARVCSKWRRIALSTTALWSNIHVPHIYDSKSAKKYIQVVRALCDYGVNSPISLDVLLNYRPGAGADDDVVKELTQLLVVSAARLEHLSFHGDCLSIHSLLSLPPGSMQKLSSLKLADLVFATSRSDACTALHNAPNLRRVTFIYTLPSKMDDIPFSQLTHLTIVKTEMTSATAFHILVLCGDLVECALHFKNSDQVKLGGYTQSKTKTISQLKVLRLQVAADQGAPFLWISFLRLPSLVDFRFANFDRSLEWHPSWTPVITHSGRLENLDLCVNISAPDLEEVLGGTPNLLELDVSPTLLLISVISRMSRGDLLPHLKSLRWCILSLSTESDACLDMLESRKHGGNGAAHIAEVGFSLSPPRLYHPRVKKLIEDGWDMRFLA